MEVDRRAVCKLPSGMAGRILHSRALYDSLTEGYRLHPGIHTRAAARAGCHWRAAKRAYELGWPKYTWAPPIRLTIAQEGDIARVRAAEVAKKQRELDDSDREKSRQASIETLTEEANIGKAMRKDVLNAALLVAELTQAMRAMIRVVMREVLEPEADGSFNMGRPRFKLNPTIAPLAAMKMVAAYTNMAAKVAYAGETIIQLGRTERGQNNVVVGTNDMSEAQAMEELRAAAEIVKSLEADAALEEEQVH